MSCDSFFTKSPRTRSSESDASAPELEDNCASPIGGETNSHAVNNYIVESDPFAKDCDPVSDDDVDPKLDEIFSSSKEFYMEKTPTGPSVTESRKAKKQKQKETQLRLQQKREDERLRKLDLIGKQGGEQLVKSNKHGQRKVDLVRQKTVNTTKKSFDQVQPVVQPPVYNDRRLYNDKSFDGDVVRPVKTIEKEVHEDTGDFKINYHFMMKNQTDGSAFTYGKTLIKKHSEVEKREMNKVSKTQDSYNKRFLSRANFAYDLEGKELPPINKEKMDTNQKNDNDGISVLQQEKSSTSEQVVTVLSEQQIEEAVAKQKKQIADEKIKYLQSRCPPSTSSKIEEFTGSYDPTDGLKTVEKEIETKMESIKKEEEISQSSVRQDSETLAALAALSAQVAELTKVITEQSKELALLRSELAEKDREIKALKELPKQDIAKVSEEKIDTEDKSTEEVEKPSTSEPQISEEKVEVKQIPKQKVEVKQKKKKDSSISKSQTPPNQDNAKVSENTEDKVSTDKVDKPSTSKPKISKDKVEVKQKKKKDSSASKSQTEDKVSTEKVDAPSVSSKDKVEDKQENKKNSSTSKPQMPPRSNTMPVSKFEDDGVDKLVNMDKATTPAEKVEVIKNTMTLPKEVRAKAVNQEIRPANAEKVSEKSFAEKLAAGLIRSKSSIRWIKKIAQEPTVPKPKGIQEKAWVTILKQTPETLENWEAKRKVKIFEQYKRLFYAQHVRLELQWQQAAIKAKMPKIKNDWLIAPGKVVALLRQEKLEDVLKSIQEWRNKAATYVPKDSKIAADWAKTPLPAQE